MNLKLGIVGLPNVGKSSLFNALTEAEVPSENYAFTTIEPNVGVVPVFDERLDKLAKVVEPEKKIPATVEFVDIAGLVKGANKGEGLGNQFLANIREVAAIVQVVRVFEDSDVLHVESSVDPERDVEIINTELILKDIETVSKKLDSIKAKARADKSLQPQLDYLEKLATVLDEGKLANTFQTGEEDKEEIQVLRKSLQLLTNKTFLYILNVESDSKEETVARYREILAPYPVLALDIKLESEIMEMEGEDRQEFMEAYGIETTGLELLTRAAYELLGLISYFTAGKQEVRAWTVSKGADAVRAAGTIHTDFAKNFIAAEVVAYEDFVDMGGWLAAKEKGKIQLQSRDYVVQDGDVMNFKVNT